MLKRKNTIGFIAALGVTSALVLTSCSGGGAGDSDAGVVDPNKVDVVRIDMSTDSGKNYNPMTASNQFVGMFLTTFYDSLLRLTETGDLEPSLAEEYSWSDDGLVLTFKLHEGVVFHDGEAFNAEAVKAYIEAAKALETSTLKNDLAAVESVVAVDDTTVEFHLSAPDGALPATLSGRAGMIISPAALENADLDRYPVGAGPYKLTEHQPGDSVKLERFEDYYDFDEARVEQIDMTIQLDPEARLRNMQSGQADIAQMPPTQMTTAESSGVHVEVFETGKNTILTYMNMADGTPLADQRVREAISHAIDREAVSETLFNGLCEPTSRVFSPGTWYASTERLSETAEYDIEKAKSLMAEAGYADGLTLSYTAINVPPYSTLVEALSGELAQIGITLDIQVSEPAQIVGGFTQQKVYDTYTSAWPGGADPASTVNQLLLPTSLFNPGGINVPEIVDLATQGRAAVDQDERAAIYQQLESIAAEQSVHVPICSLPQTYAIAENVKGVKALANGIPDYSFMRVEG